jgi:hypothetical protein
VSCAIDCELQSNFANLTTLMELELQSNFAIDCEQDAFEFLHFYPLAGPSPTSGRNLIIFRLMELWSDVVNVVNVCNHILF